MWGIFRSAPLVSPESASWQFETFRWLMRNAGGYAVFRSTPLVLPTDEFFPDKGLRGHDGVRALFDRVRHHAGMAEWPCELRAQEEDEPHHIAEMVNVQRSSESAAGTFSIGGETSAVPVITYNPAISRDPMALVATFAHELAHYLCATFPEEPPGGEPMHEPATDLTAVFMGFGIFLANSSFKFDQFSEGTTLGWRAGTQGYLPESELIFALAICCSLHEDPWKDQLIHLDNHLRPILKKAMKQLESHAVELAALREISSSASK